jgi:23S rRNA pseudouridine955/2504/2580 synthase
LIFAMDHPFAGGPAGAAARTVVVEDDEVDRRLDNFLIARLKGVPRAHVYRIIRSGQVRVNSRRAGPERRLKAGDRVRIPPVKAAPGTAGHAVRARKAAWIEARVLYEDADLLVLDKPAGLAVHGGSGVSLGAIELLRAARPEARLLALAHRLDRDTSGCLLIAKTQSSLRRLQAEFRAGKVEKIYLALLVGKLDSREVTVDVPLRTSERRGGERYVRADADGKPALTRFSAQTRLASATLVRVTLLTGRTHQIRVHAAHLGLPLAGDERYGVTPDPIVARWGLNRLFLHAASIAFQSPSDVGVIRVESPLPEDLAAVIRRMSRK